MSHFIQTIVSHLNDPPHDLNLRLVEFNEKKPRELIQILLNIFASIDPSSTTTTTHTHDHLASHTHNDLDFPPNGNPQQYQQFDARLYHQNDQAVKKTIIPLLSSLQYDPKSMPKDEDELDTFVNSIANGDPKIIYPILLYCLTNQNALKERMYLHPFLTPIQLPLDVTMTQHDETLSDLSRAYQVLQHDFQNVHRKYVIGKEKEDALNQKSIENDLDILRDEKEQLLNKIGEMEDRVKRNQSNSKSNSISTGVSESSFERLLEATSALRREQDEDGRLRDQLEEQKRVLESTNAKLQQVQNRHESIRVLHGGSSGHIQSGMNGTGTFDAESILDGVRREVAEVTMHVRSTLVSERRELEDQMTVLKAERDRPLRTEEELEQIIANREQLQQEYDTKSVLLRKEKAKTSHRKIAMFKQDLTLEHQYLRIIKHATISATKVKAKEIELQSKVKQLNDMNEKVKNLQAKITNVEPHMTIDAEPIELRNGRILRGAEIQKYVDYCQDLSIEAEARKKLVLDLSNEVDALSRTISGLKEKQENVRQAQEEREERAGVKGFNSIQETLKCVNQNTEKVNREKGETLQEISDMVTEMTEKLKKDRENLQPKITSLKAMRTEFKRVQNIHDDKKSIYDKLSSKLASARNHLEKECKRLQSDWKQAERNYHYLASANEIIGGHVDKAMKKNDWQNGENKMLPDFQYLNDLYKHKLVQQENLAKTPCWLAHNVNLWDPRLQLR